MSNTLGYTLLFFAALAALIYGAVLLRFPATWIVIGALAANAIGIVWASSYTSGAAPPPA
jgi:hypothetical protein